MWKTCWKLAAALGLSGCTPSGAIVATYDGSTYVDATSDADGGADDSGMKGSGFVCPSINDGGNRMFGPGTGTLNDLPSGACTGAGTCSGGEQCSPVGACSYGVYPCLA